MVAAVADNRVLGTGDLDYRRGVDNVRMGAAYLAHLLAIMPSTRRALAAYYSGPQSIGHRLTRGQRHYADLVLEIRRRFMG